MPTSQEKPHDNSFITYLLKLTSNNVTQDYKNKKLL
ncbi:hypothetical protein PMI28_01360 [Pseudomonas sp. GM48]|nr:hypothetical protein PMI28_01360 [Pseudomonas sp. GM48]